jgi:hypothetical protein
MPAGRILASYCLSQYFDTFTLVMTHKGIFLQHLAIQVEAKEIGFGPVANFDAFQANTFVRVTRHKLERGNAAIRTRRTDLETANIRKILVSNDQDIATALILVHRIIEGSSGYFAWEEKPFPTIGVPLSRLVDEIALRTNPSGLPHPVVVVLPIDTLKAVLVIDKLHPLLSSFPAMAANDH